MTQIVAAQAGIVRPITEALDPVFAQEIVGPGVALDPDRGRATAVSPIAGKAVRVMPHAFVVLGDDGVGVLVHLGINTVRLKGEGFEVHARQGDQVEAGTPMVTWDPYSIPAEDMHPTVLVVAMDRPAGSLDIGEPGRHVEPGDALFNVH